MHDCEARDYSQVEISLVMVQQSVQQVVPQLSDERAVWNLLTGHDLFLGAKLDENATCL